jgi:uncharacterized protein RhaS with RHS repeats
MFCSTVLARGLEVAPAKTGVRRAEFGYGTDGRPRQRDAQGTRQLSKLKT